MTTRISAVKDPAVSGYAHAFVAVKPCLAIVDGKRLIDKAGRVRRFATEGAALTAARKAT